MSAIPHSSAFALLASLTTTTKIRYVAVAITPADEFVPFGPVFASEDEAWRWLHFDSIAIAPVHKAIDVFPLAA